MTRRGKRRSVGGKRRIADVRVVPRTEDARGQRVERMISSVKSTVSQVRVLVHSFYDYSTVTSPGINTYSFTNIRSEADYGEYAALYTTWRVSGLRFEIFDQNPNVYGNAIFGTYHVNDGADAPSTQSQIYQLPDVDQVPSGAGPLVMYWTPTGTTEMGFYTTDNGGEDFGGLAVYTGGTSTVQPKWRLTVTAVIDFRARK